MARAIKEVASATRVQIEEDPWHHNHFLLQAGLEKVQPVVDAFGQLFEIEPEVECTVGTVSELESTYCWV